MIADTLKTIVVWNDEDDQKHVRVITGGPFSEAASKLMRALKSDDEDEQTENRVYDGVEDESIEVYVGTQVYIEVDEEDFDE